MTELRVGLMTTAAEHFPYERPVALHAQAKAALERIGLTVCAADRLVVDPASAQMAVDQFRAAGVDMLISLVGSFTWDNMPVRVVQELNVPVMLWGVPEPPMDGGRLETNSLVGVTMNAAALKRLGCRYKFVYGLPGDGATENVIGRTARVLTALKRLRGARLGVLGARPPGFYGSTYDELRLRRALGVEIIPIEVSEVLAAYDRVTTEQEASSRRQVTAVGRCVGAGEEDVTRVSRLHAAMEGLVRGQELSAVAVKCWPEMKDHMLNPCVVNGMLTDAGVMMGCETDVHGTLTMLILNSLNGKPAFFSDLVTFDEQKNTVLLWHCGAAAPSMAESREKVALETHSIGTGTAVVEFPLKPGRVTFSRLGPTAEGYRLLIVPGDAVPTSMLLRGNNLLVHTDLPARQVIERIIERGIEHHYAMTYGDLREDLLDFCFWADVEPETLES